MDLQETPGAAPADRPAGMPTSDRAAAGAESEVARPAAVDERPARPRERSRIRHRRARAENRGAPGAGAHLELPTVALVPMDGREAPLSVEVATLLDGPPLDETLASGAARAESVLERAESLARRAYPADETTDRATDPWIDHDARDELHRALLACYQLHVRLPHQGGTHNQLHPFTCRLLAVLERPWERDTLDRARRTAARLGVELSDDGLPRDPQAFVEWFQQAAFTHPLYEHEVYGFLASEADRAQLEGFLRLEAAGEAAFDDLVALGQVGTRGAVKIEMGRNYWDEMGNGRSHAVHTHLFHRLTEGLDLEVPTAAELPWTVLSGVNLMLWSCIERRNAFRAQGTLGAVELLAPQRCTRLVHGALRVGIPKRAMSYYAAHAIIDVDHAEGWLGEVVRPQVEAVPQARVGIAEGLLARADASLDYFDHALRSLRLERAA